MYNPFLFFGLEPKRFPMGLSRISSTSGLNVRPKIAIFNRIQVEKVLIVYFVQ